MTEEEKARIRAKMGKKEDDKEESKASAPAKRGRAKKTPAERYAEEGEPGGKRTAGRRGTAGRLDRGAPHTPKKAPVVNPDVLANKVMAETPMSMSLPAPNPRRETLAKVAPSTQGTFHGRALLPPPEQRGLAFMRNLFGSREPQLPPFKSPGANALPGVTPRVTMQGAEARPTPRPGPVKPKIKAKPKMKPAEHEPAKKSSRDRLADRMMDEDIGSQDYYEKLKRGSFRMG